MPPQPEPEPEPPQPSGGGGDGGGDGGGVCGGAAAAAELVRASSRQRAHLEGLLCLAMPMGVFDGLSAAKADKLCLSALAACKG
eukprot:COSAG01_NODE_6102_length_3849_cov_17.469333_6_plen_84_part_00